MLLDLGVLTVNQRWQSSLLDCGLQLKRSTLFHCFDTAIVLAAIAGCSIDVTLKWPPILWHLSGLHMHESHFVSEQFQPTKAFSFPKRQFGSKGEERSLCSEWCDTFSWLHYDVDKNAAFCYLCMRCEAEKKFLASTKWGAEFIYKGFTYWKEGPKAFKTHQGSDCHREAVNALVVLPWCTKDVGELQSAEHQSEKAQNRKMLLLVLQNLRFLARQGSPLWGDGDESFYSEMCTVARLILVMPASNAVSEWAFSVMWRIKSYLRSTMGQACLNHVMVLNIYKEQADTLDLTAIANEFVGSSEHRLRFLASLLDTATP